MLAFLNENIRQGRYKKSFLSQYYRWDSHKKVIVAENNSWGMYLETSFNLIC